MPRINTTLRFIQERDSNLSIPLAPSTRLNKPRTGYTIGEPGDVTSDEQLAKYLAETPADTDFFLDASFIPGRREVRRSVWEALLARKVMIPTFIWDELADWIATPYANQWFRDVLLAARRDGDPRVRFLEPLAIDDPLRKAGLYYVELLGFRKRFFQFAERNLRERLGREPNEGEIDAEVKKTVERGVNLAQKGKKDLQKPNLLADEALVVRAILSGICSGRPTAILSQDTDVLEQFFKATYLIDTHYRCYLMGEEHARQPLNFPERDAPEFATLVEPDGARLLLKPHLIENDLLPSNSRPVLISCTCVGGPAHSLKFSSLDFLAIDRMQDLLLVKARTGGRSTERFGDRNLHICIHPRFVDEFGDLALIGRDKSLTHDGLQFSAIDLELSISGREGCDRYVETEVPASAFSPSGSLGISLAQALTPAQLGFSLAKGWEPINESELIAAINWFEPRGRFFLDDSVLKGAFPPAALSALQGRGAMTSPSSRESALACATANSVVKSDLERETRGWLRTGPFLGLEGPYLCAFEQYAAVLAHKRALGPIVRETLERKLSREPTDEEWRARMRDFVFAERRILRAETGVDSGCWDEVDRVLVHAAMTAVLKGIPITLMTRRRDVFEQFMSLSACLVGQYQAWAVTERIHEDLPKELKDGDPSLRKMRVTKAFHISVLNLRDKSGSEPEDAVSMFFRLSPYLPPDALTTTFSCWLLEGTEVGRIFMGACALERPMHKLFAVKGETNGRNTDRLGDLNVHLQGSSRGGRPHVELWTSEFALTKIGSQDFPTSGNSPLATTTVPTWELIAAQNQADCYQLPWHAAK